MRVFTAGLAVLAALLIAACGGGGSTTIRNASGSGGASLSPSGSGHSRTAATATTVTATATATATGASGATTSASGGAGLASGSASATPPCSASGLALSFLGQQGATGHGELGFALRNTGATSCSTVGYPGVQFLTSSGAALPTTPSHTTTDFFGHTVLRTLTVAPGQSVSFRLGVSHGVASSAGCTTADGLQVIAPNDTATLRTAIPDGASECAATTVSPVQAGDSAYP